MNDTVKGPFNNKKYWYHQFANVINSKLNYHLYQNIIVCMILEEEEK